LISLREGFKELPMLVLSKPSVQFYPKKLKRHLGCVRCIKQGESVLRIYGINPERQFGGIIADEQEFAMIDPII
jgi:hypothetical protein